MMELFHRSMNQVRKSSIPMGQDRKKQGPAEGGRERRWEAGGPQPHASPKTQPQKCVRQCYACLGKPSKTAPKEGGQ